MSIVDICKDKGLNIQEIEPFVYKNKTIDNLVNIDILKRTIDNCTLFISENIDTQKTTQGYTTSVAKVYYILLGTEDKEKIKKLYAKVKLEHPKVYISKYKSNENITNDVLTVYSPEEVGRV